MFYFYYYLSLFRHSLSMDLHANKRAIELLHYSNFFVRLTKGRFERSALLSNTDEITATAHIPAKAVHTHTHAHTHIHFLSLSLSLSLSRQSKLGFSKKTLYIIVSTRQIHTHAHIHTHRERGETVRERQTGRRTRACTHTYTHIYILSFSQERRHIKKILHYNNTTLPSAKKKGVRISFSQGQVYPCLRSHFLPLICVVSHSSPELNPSPVSAQHDCTCHV